MNVEVGSTGAGFTVTDNIFTASIDPVIPLQVRVYEALAVGETLFVPLVAITSVQEPDAVQELALEDVQFNVVDCPAVIVAEDTVNVEVGWIMGLTVTDNVFAVGVVPVTPLQVKV